MDRRLQRLLDRAEIKEDLPQLSQLEGAKAFLFMNVDEVAQEPLRQRAAGGR